MRSEARTYVKYSAWSIVRPHLRWLILRFCCFRFSFQKQIFFVQPHRALSYVPTRYLDKSSRVYAESLWYNRRGGLLSLSRSVLLLSPRINLDSIGVRGVQETDSGRIVRKSKQKKFSLELIQQQSMLNIRKTFSGKLVWIEESLNSTFETNKFLSIFYWCFYSV